MMSLGLNATKPASHPSGADEFWEGTARTFPSAFPPGFLRFVFRFVIFFSPAKAYFPTTFPQLLATPNRPSPRYAASLLTASRKGPVLRHAATPSKIFFPSDF